MDGHLESPALTALWNGDGLRGAIAGLLADPRLIDPAPRSRGSAAATNDATDTADWSDPSPGNLRVDYVLPSADWQVVDSGVFWPTPEMEMATTIETASRHRLVWVDLTRP